MTVKDGASFGEGMGEFLVIPVHYEYRVVDTGDVLTVGLVEFDPIGQPASVTLELPEADSLADLLTILKDFSKCVNHPVLDVRLLL